MTIDVANIHSRSTVTRAWLLTPVEKRDPTEHLVDCVVIALGTDRLARTDDTLPVAGDNDRHGWRLCENAVVLVISV